MDACWCCNTLAARLASQHLLGCVCTCRVLPPARWSLFSLFFFFSPQQSMHSALSEHCFHLTSLLPSDYFLLLLLPLLPSRQKGLLLLLSVSDSISLLFPLFSAPSMTCICSGCQSRVTQAEQWRSRSFSSFLWIIPVRFLTKRGASPPSLSVSLPFPDVQLGNRGT